MTNLDVLRAVQHVAWPAYCWPFTNGSSGNGYAIGSSPSPPGLTMVESKLSITPSSETTTSSTSNRNKRPRSHSRTPSSYEEHLLKMTSLAATLTTPTPPSSSPPGIKGVNSDVKSERLSPDSVNNNSPSTTNNNNTNNEHRSSNSPSSKTKQKDTITSHGGNSTPSPSASPKSHASNRTRTPSSFPGTPPHPAFTPPISLPPGCFSPAALGSLGAMGGIPGGPGNLAVLSRAQNFMESPMPRNCSDLMRSMAAKYNTNTSPTNNVEFYNNHVAKPFPRLPINPLVATKHNYQAMNSNLPHSTGVDQPQTSRGPAPADTYSSSDSNHSRGPLNRLPPGLLPANGTQNNFPVGVSSHTPLNNLSSTQALLDMVRNASHHVSSRIQTPPSVPERDAPADDRDKHDQSLNYLNASAKRAAESSCPLDLSSSVSAKRSRTEESSGIYGSTENLADYRQSSLGPLTPSSESKQTTAQSNCSTPVCKSNEDILSWTVDDVCAFVRSIDLCAEYADVFREQRIDGWCLSLLTENHLTTSLDMKLGPALKLKAILSSKTGQQQVPCSQCTNCQNNNVHDESHESEQPSNLSQRSPTHSHSQRSPIPTRAQRSPVPSHSESPTHSLPERSGFCHDSPQYLSSPQPSEGDRSAKPVPHRENRTSMTSEK